MPVHVEPSSTPTLVPSVSGTTAVQSSAAASISPVSAASALPLHVEPSSTPTLAPSVSGTAAVQSSAAAAAPAARDHIRVQSSEVAPLRMTPGCLHGRQDRLARLNNQLTSGDRLIEGWKYPESYPSVRTWRDTLDGPQAGLTRWWVSFMHRLERQGQRLGSHQLESFVKWAEIQLRIRDQTTSPAAASSASVPSVTASPAAACGPVCCICVERPARIVFDPCGHCCLCTVCIEPHILHGRQSCPLCRQVFRQYIRAYFS